MRLADKVTIITGAGGGMGRVAARMFAAEGARVVVAEYGEAAGQETVDPIRADGGEATFVRVDVSRRPTPRRWSTMPSPRTAGSTASTTTPGSCPRPITRVTDTAVDVWDQVMAVNVRGVFLGCKYAIPAMVAAGAGASSTSRASSRSWAARAAGRLHRLEGRGPLPDPQPGRPVRAEGHPDQRHLPGSRGDAAAHGLAGQGRGGQALRLARNPTGRFGKPEEIVHMAVYLASDESRWTNGASLVVDGGITVNYF